MNSLLPGLNQEEEVTQVEYTSEEAIQLGADVVNLEHEADKLLSDYAQLDKATATIAKINLEGGDVNVKALYELTIEAIASDLGVSEEVTIDKLSQESIGSDIKDYIKATMHMYHLFAVKFMQIVKKYYLKAMAWVVSSDKKRDKVLKALNDDKGYLLSDDDYNSVIPILRLKTARVLQIDSASLSYDRYNNREQHIKNSILNLVKNESNDQNIIDGNKLLSGRNKSLLLGKTFKGKLSDEEYAAIAGEDVTVNISVVATHNNKVDFLVDSMTVTREDEEASYFAKVITRELEDVPDKDILSPFKQGIKSKGDTAKWLTNLPKAKEMQKFISAGFDNISGFEKMIKEVNVAPGKHSDFKMLRQAVDAIKKRSMAYSKTAYGEGKNIISEYRYTMKLATAVASFKDGKGIAVSTQKQLT